MVQTTMSEELPREEGLPSEEGLPERRICAVVQGCDQHSCEMLCFYLFGFSIIMFVSAFVASGCVLFLLMVAFALSFKSGEKENRCRLRAALVIHVLGLLLLVVAIVLLAMKTHRVTSLPDPTCEPWAGSCQEGGQRSDGRTECSDCSDEVSNSTCVDLATSAGETRTLSGSIGPICCIASLVIWSTCPWWSSARFSPASHVAAARGTRRSGGIQSSSNLPKRCRMRRRSR